MEDILTGTYASETVEGVLSPYDGLSLGIIAALKGNGYGGGGKDLPVVTGQDAEVQSVKSILAGEQYSTIFKDTRELARVTVDMIKALGGGRGARGQRHRDLRQRRQGRPVVPPRAGAGREGRRPERARRLRLLHRGRAQVTPSRAGPAIPAAGHGTDAGTGGREEGRWHMAQPILEMRGITKEFPGVKALSDVNLTVQRGEIHAICGENGAGKSTLMKVLSGVYPHGTYDGDILFEGEPVEFNNIRQSEAAGIVIIHQELALIPELSIAENIFLGNETATRGVINWDEANHQAIELMARVGLRENPLTPVKHLGIGKQQLVEIAKALGKEVKLLILDEPTAALNDDDSQHLLDLLKGLQGQGHHLDHDQPQAERDRADRRRDHDHPRRPHHRDPRRRRRTASTRTASSAGWSAGTSSTGSPSTRPTIGDVLFELRDWTVMHPQDHSRGRHPRRQPHRAQRRDRRHRRAHGRRAHRARPQHLRPLLRQPARGHAAASTGKEVTLRSVHDRDRRGHRLRQRGPQGARAEPPRRHQDLDHLGRAATSCARA